MDRMIINEKRIVDPRQIRSIEKNGSGLSGNITVTWSNGDKEVFMGEEGKHIWECWK